MSSKRRAGTGHLYEKYGSYYGRWRTLDGRLVNRKVVLNATLVEHPRLG